MRYPSIDILRTVAIFVMVCVHFSENLSGYSLPVAGLGAPLFAFLSGVSYRLWSGGLRARGVSEAEISKISVRRALFVFGAGFAFNILVWLPEDTFNWDVLTFIGAALLLLNGLRRLPVIISVLVAVIAVFVSPVLRKLADYQAYWVNGYFECDLTLSDILIGFLATGYFPIFPWIAFSLAGFTAASRLFALPADSNDMPPSVRPILGIGGALIAASAVILLARPHLPAALTRDLLRGWTMFPPTVTYVLGTLGMALVLLAAAHRYVDGNPRVLRHQGLLAIAKTFSRYALTIYVLHHIVHLWPLWLYGLATGNEPTHFWMRALPLAASLPLAGLFLLGCYGLLRRLGPEKTYGLESLMRWLCD